MGRLIVEGGTIVTVDSSRRIISDGAIVVDNDRIVEVGKRNEIVKEHHADQIVDARGKAIIPGFVNVHTHTSEKLVPGLADDLNLYSWLQTIINPMMMNLTIDDCYWTSLLAQIEMIKSGITCYSDHFDTTIESIFDTLIGSVDASGIRGVISREIFTKDALPSELALSVSDDIDEKMIDDTVKHVKRRKDESRATVRVGLGGISYASESLMERVRSLAHEFGVGVHVHAAESLDELRYFKQKKDTTPIRHAHRVGLLGPDVLLAHCVWVDSEEIRLLKETKSNVAYNPVSNMKLADGVAPIWTMVQEGVNVGLGTDGPASNDNLDMFCCMKVGAYLQKVHALNPSCLPSQKTLEMATIDGARALQMEDIIGSIEVGKKADLTVIDLRTPNMTPTNDIVKQIVCSCTPSNVDTVIVDGEVILEDRKFTRVDEAAAIKECRRRGTKLIERMYG